ncbi:MAG: hypothetical protein WCS43_06500 [Verrucomicrobiota bacterium]
MFNQNKHNGARWKQLSSDADLKAEALRMLPKAANQQAETLWQIMKRQLKLNSTQRGSVMKDLMRPYTSNHSPESRVLLKEIEAALKKGHSSSTWLGTGRARVSKSPKRKS